MLIFQPLGRLSAPVGAYFYRGAIHRKRLHIEQYRHYRRACYRLAFTAKSLQETASSLGPLGFPFKLTCGIALSLVRALFVSSNPFYQHNFSLIPMIQGMVTNCQVCSEIADLVTGYLNTIREELDESAKGDANSGPWFTTMLCKGLCCD